MEDRGLFQVAGRATLLVGRRIIEVRATLAYDRDGPFAESEYLGRNRHADIELTLDDGSLVCFNATGYDTEGIAVRVREAE